MSKVVTLFGASAFLGRYVIEALTSAGFVCRVATRNLELAEKLKLIATPGRVVPVYSDVRELASLSQTLAGSFAVLNLVASFAPKDNISSSYLHSQFPEKLARMCEEGGIQRLIHVSNITVESPKSPDDRSRLLGEEALVNGFSSALVLRLAPIFGKGDILLSFLQMCAGSFRFLPLFNHGASKIQPIYGVDVAQIIARALISADPIIGIKRLAGPEILPIRSLYEDFIDYHPRVKIIKFPLRLAKLISGFFKLLPPLSRVAFGKPGAFSVEALDLLSQDSIIDIQSEEISNLVNYTKTPIKEAFKEIYSNNS